MDKIKILGLAGLDESGRDCYVLEINDDMFVIEAGSSLPDKTIPGVDYLLPNADYIKKNKDRLKAYIITHGHDESMASLKYFYKKAPAPIYCTKTTKQSIIYQGIIIGVDVLKTVGMKFEIVKPSDDVVIAGHKVHFFQTCHNISNSMGIVFETDRGNIVYTSDFIVDYSLNDETYHFDLLKLSSLAEKDTLLLISPSKGANQPGYCAPKHRLFNHIEKYFEDPEKRIFATCFWQNMFRIREICKLCKKYHKKVYPYDDYTRKVLSMITNLEPGMLVESDIISKEDFLRIKPQDMLVLILGHDKEIFNKIIALSLNSQEDKRISLSKNDVFISGALPLPTQEVIATKAHDGLYRTGCEVVWLKSKDLSSMHAHQDDLQVFLAILRPKYYLPVRGPYVKLLANARLAASMGIGLNYNNIFMIDNGDELIFDDKPKPTIIANATNKIDTTPILVDGFGFSDIAQNVIDERNRLSQDGTVVVAGTVDLTERKLVAGPDCQMRGFVYVKEAEPLLKSVANIYADEIKSAFRKYDNPNWNEVRENIAERSTHFIKRENGREPLVIPVIVVEK